MRHTIHKWFWAWDFEKEEKWLNEMSSKGLQLVGVGFCKYVFEESLVDEYSYRLELLENRISSLESTSYIEFLEETGVEYIGSVFRWSYFRKKVAAGKFEIYSDLDSKIKHYKRILKLFILVTPINLISSFNNLTMYIENRLTPAIVISMLGFLVSILLGFGIFKVSKKISGLKKEKSIHE